MDLNFKINGKGLIGLVLLSTSIAFGSYVSIVDVESAGGIVIEEEQLPVGSITMWGGSSAPNGWLELNGGTTTGYPELAKIYGARLPDFRGEFVRGWDSGKGIDAGRGLLTLQSNSVQPLTFKGDSLPPHSHQDPIAGQHDHRYSTERSNNTYWGRGNPNSRWNTSSVSAGTPTGIIEGTGSETRPRNISVMYIVKAE